MRPRGSQRGSSRTSRRAGAWRPGGYVSFEIRDPDRRRISAAPFRDRVVHHRACGGRALCSSAGSSGIAHKVLKADSVGASRPVGAPASRPALPLLRNLTRALDWLTLWTTLRFADHSGRVIHEQEFEHGAADKYGYSLPVERCDPALMTANDRQVLRGDSGTREGGVEGALFGIAALRGSARHEALRLGVESGATAGPTVARPAGTSDRLCQRGDADGAHRLLAEPDAVLPAQQLSNWLRRLFG